MLSSIQIPYDLSRRRKDQFSTEFSRERPFNIIVFIVQDWGVRCLYFEGWVGVFLYADVSLFYTKINSMNYWQFSSCDKRKKTLRDFIVRTK